MECNRGRRVDQNFDLNDENWDHNWNIVDVIADEILPAIVPERDKECDVTAKRADTKETTWSMLDRGTLQVLEEVYKHFCWWYELCRDENWEGRSRQRIWRQRECPRSGTENRLLPSCKIRLEMNGETITCLYRKVYFHKNRSCKKRRTCFVTTTTST